MGDDARTSRSSARQFHHASELIGRRWTGAIIFVLLQSRCRFATLRTPIPDITDRMLSDRLQELEQEGIVERTVIPETPVRVEYLADQKGPGAGGGDGRDRRVGREMDGTRQPEPKAAGTPRPAAARH